MVKLSKARVNRHAEHARERTARITAALIADPMQANTVLARTLGYANVFVNWVRADLEEAGRIPPRDGRPQKRPPARYVGSCTYDEKLEGKVRSDAQGRASKDSDRSRRTRELEAAVTELWGRMTQMEIANACHVTPGRVSQIGKDLGLPPPPRGRPPRNI